MTVNFKYQLTNTNLDPQREGTGQGNVLCHTPSSGALAGAVFRHTNNDLSLEGEPYAEVRDMETMNIRRARSLFSTDRYLFPVMTQWINFFVNPIYELPYHVYHTRVVWKWRRRTEITHTHEYEHQSTSMKRRRIQSIIGENDDCQSITSNDDQSRQWPIEYSLKQTIMIIARRHGSITESRYRTPVSAGICFIFMIE